MDKQTPREIDVAALARLRRKESSSCVLDVREPWEIRICAVADSLNIPMREIPGRLAEIPRDRTVVVPCHHGQRSLMVADWLREQGFGGATSLRGGIDAWAGAMDLDMARY